MDTITTDTTFASLHSCPGTETIKQCRVDGLPISLEVMRFCPCCGESLVLDVGEDRFSTVGSPVPFASFQQ
jgi:hypothetical protein